jgi:hypothetical protein
MKLNILITESQERMILTESAGNHLGDLIKNNSNIGKMVLSQVKDVIGGDKNALITFGASIGGIMGPVGQFISGQYPTLTDVELSLLLTGAIATFFLNSPRLLKKISDEVEKQGLEEEYSSTLSKTEELKNAFYDFMESLNITFYKMTNVLGFAFLIPLLPYIHELSGGNISVMEINKIVKILISYGVITISGAVLKEIMVKLIKRFRG